MTRRLTGLVMALALLASIGIMPTLAAPAFANPAFQRTWLRTDDPVAQLQVHRSWIWGPGPNTGALQEVYTNAPGGTRTVQYFDKSRMEDNSFRAAPPWDVTNGLLAEELITGKMQFGDTTFRQFTPAQVNVAGDSNDPNGPTYATFNPLMGYGAIPNGWLIIQTVNRAGNVGADLGLASSNVRAVDVGAPTHHNVASVFWDFMNSSGLVNDNGALVTEPLFLNPFYATGYPLTEAYWTNVLVGGVSKQVLVQVFERRVLTYTPSNPDGWKVEAGNEGLHYYAWRYQLLGNPGPTAPHTIQASAAISNSTPAQNTSVTVTGTITDNGSGISGVPMTATWHFATGDQTCTGTSGSDGTASCSLNIGNAAAGTGVKVDVAFSYNSQTYAASTNFTPQAPDTSYQVNAWVSDATPTVNTHVLVYGEFKHNGHDVAGASMTATGYVNSTALTCSALGLTPNDGTASCSLDISNVPSGYTVNVKVDMTYNGQTYEAWTSFTPQ